MEKRIYTLIDENTSNLAFKYFQFDSNQYFDHLQRNNYYSLIWVKKGNGLLKVDFSEYLFSENTLFAFSPYQPFMFSSNSKFEGVAIQFHSDFYCIHRNPKETNCDTVLFNNIYKVPFFRVDKELEEILMGTLRQMENELRTNPGEYELIIPFLKIMLINASRSRVDAMDEKPKYTESNTPSILAELKRAIEENFKEMHSPSDYASILNISPNSLAKLVKKHFNKTLSNLIAERIIIESKRELYMTTKSIKEIAWKLGYEDEFYFSRFFKKNTDISPQMYRETVGFGKAE